MSYKLETIFPLFGFGIFFKKGPEVSVPQNKKNTAATGQKPRPRFGYWQPQVGNWTSFIFLFSLSCSNAFCKHLKRMLWLDYQPFCLQAKDEEERSHYRSLCMVCFLQEAHFLRQRATSHVSLTSIRYSWTHRGQTLLFSVAINSSDFLCEHSNFESFSVIIYSSEDTHLLCGSRLWSFSCSTISTLLHRN